MQIFNPTQCCEKVNSILSTVKKWVEFGQMPLWKLPIFPLDLLTWFIMLLGEGNGNPLQFSCLENPMDRGAWWAAVHGVAKSRIRLSVFTFTLTHWRRKWQPTRVLAWRIPGAAKPGGLLSMGSQSRTRLKWLGSIMLLDVLILNHPSY